MKAGKAIVAIGIVVANTLAMEHHGLDDVTVASTVLAIILVNNLDKLFGNETSLRNTERKRD